MKKDNITMSQQELKRLHVIQRSEEKLIIQKEAANIIGISQRQYRRCVKKYREYGPKGLVHQLRGQSSNRAFSAEKEQEILDIYTSEFQGYKPTFFTEKLYEEYRMTISSEKIRQLLIKHNLWIPKLRKHKHRKKRERKHHRGELIQLDGSVHQWFKTSEGYCVLMLFIDDATNTIFARFYNYEGTLPAMDLLRRYISKYGVPTAIYSDRHSTYRNNNKQLSLEEQLAGKTAETQFSSALVELSIDIIFAFSPQAKGRVERSFETLQDRLCKELHRHNITTMKEANTFLGPFLKKHNKRFSVVPALQADLHRPALPMKALNNIFCIKTKRAIANDFTLQHNNQLFQLEQPTIHKKAIVENHLNGSIHIRIKKKLVPFKDITYMFTPRKKTKQQHKIINIDPISLKEIAL